MGGEATLMSRGGAPSCARMCAVVSELSCGGKFWETAKGRGWTAAKYVEMGDVAFRLEGEARDEVRASRLCNGLILSSTE